MANPVASIILTAVDRTKAAFGTVKNGLASMRESALGLRTLLAGLGAGISLAAFVGQMKSAIDAMDKADEAAGRIGTTAENFSALSYAAEQSGVPVQELEDAMAKLARTLEQARAGTGAAADVFRRLQIDPKQFSDPADALAVLADRFAAMPDGITKTALAQEIFGRSGARLVPLLNQGATGLAALREEAARLGAVFDNETAAAAATLNDNLDKLRAASRGFNAEVARDMVPMLTQITQAMTEAAREGSLLKAALVGLGGLGAALFTNEFESASAALDRLNAQLARATTGFFQDRNAATRLRAEIEVVKARIKQEEDLAAAKEKTAREEARRKTDAATARQALQDERDAAKKATEEQISDADRLKNALQSAFSQSLKAEEDYLRQARRLRAEAAGKTEVGDDPEAQAGARLDALIALMKLQRIAGTESLETVQEQAQAVRDLANALNDAEQKQSLLRDANLAEAGALERAAGDEAQRARQQADQITDLERRTVNMKAALEGFGKEVSVDLKPGPGIAQTKQELQEILNLLDRIGNKPLPVGTVVSGTGGQIVDSLRTAAAQYGRRG